MKRTDGPILIFNVGSSSLKFALFDSGASLARMLSDAIGRIGLPDAIFTLEEVATQRTLRTVVSAPNHISCADLLLNRLAERFPNLPQVACFDTVFHRGLPRVARILPIPFCRSCDNQVTGSSPRARDRGS